MIEIDFGKVTVGVADVDTYATDGKPVRIPPGVPVRRLDASRCRECGIDSQELTGLTTWLARRDNPVTPTEWITLCDEHLSSTTRNVPPLSAG